MFRFWDLVIAPVIEAVEARRVVEVGALRGDNTLRMLERLGADVELHVIDPVPAFDPTEHERRFRGRYVFHRDISHNVLPQLPPVDVALIDGDHNWYTVYHELRMLSATAQDAGEALPLLILHDVLWPYGRRDLYYTPERIPEAFRQPYEQRGMVPHAVELVPQGGLNPTLHNATRAGGPRNGVMTALDDFVREYARPLRTVIVPIHFGLAIVVDEQRLEQCPRLIGVLDELESAEGRYRQLELAESVALDDLLFQHNLYFADERRLEASARRYLNLLKGALLDEHYLENEVRLEYLRRCAVRGETPEPAKLHDPRRFLFGLSRQFDVARRAGSGAAGAQPGFSATGMGRHRLEYLETCLEVVRREDVAGDLVECGTWRGGGAIFMRGYLAAYEIAGKQVWVADPFRGLAEPEQPTPPGADPAGRPLNERADLNIVRDTFERFELLDDRVRFLQGDIAATLPDAPIEKVALLRIDTGSYESTRAALDVLYDRLTVGGFVVVDGYQSPETRRAIEEFRSERGIEEPLEHIDFAGTCWRKLSHTARGADTPRSTGHHAPLAPPQPQPPAELSVVAVFYNMRREAERTLQSLTRAYQDDIDDLDYEVIVVENGSSDEQKLGEDFVRSFGPQFRYLDLGHDATPSPAAALNRGIAVARGTSIALMIDGAHVLTPGVLRFGVLGLRSHEPAVVAVQQWYVGPGQQPDVVGNGYDLEYEDRLFEGIDWPTDGYRLFEVGHFIGERDWFDFIWESNCVFVPRRLLEQVGGFDESFSVPGGGFANFDFFERVATSPDVTLVTILGEGSFHQVHGGTTTNEPDADERNAALADYGARYVELRGRVFRGPSSRIHFVGTMFGDACRTRARHLTSPEIWRRGQRIALDGRPDKPIPIPDALKAGFVDAFWRSFAWHETSWLGQRVRKCPTDLFAYQEIIVRVRPDWVVETGSGEGGRALFLASICDLVGHGQVLCIDNKASPRLPSHPRITYLALDPVAEDTIARVRELVGVEPNAVLILGLARRNRVLAMFRAYASLVPVGSYVVFEDTITNGNPVWAGMGPGPREAVQALATARLVGSIDFVADRELERFGLTFNPGGFLRRVE